MIWYDFSPSQSSTTDVQSPKVIAARNNRIMKASTFAIAKKKWKSIILASSDLDGCIHRLGSSTIWDPEEGTLLIFGGTDTTQEEGETLTIDVLDFKSL